MLENPTAAPWGRWLHRWWRSHRVHSSHDKNIHATIIFTRQLTPPSPPTQPLCWLRDAISDNLLKVSAGLGTYANMSPHRIFFWVKSGKCLSREPSDCPWFESFSSIFTMKVRNCSLKSPLGKDRHIAQNQQMHNYSVSLLGSHRRPPCFVYEFISRCIMELHLPFLRENKQSNDK